MIVYMPLTFILLVAFLPRILMAKHRWLERRRRRRARQGARPRLIDPAGPALYKH
jgi:uncharacterized iron-regulated membrane protein